MPRITLSSILYVLFQDHKKAASRNEQDLMTSQVWICSTKQNTTHVTVVDANNPGHVIDTFPVAGSHVLCMASVPGCADDDFEWDEDNLLPPIVAKAEEASTNDVSTDASTGDSQLASIATVECATGTSPLAESHQPPEPGSILLRKDLCC